MMNPDPRLRCLNSLSGAFSKNLLKKSSPPKNLGEGISFPKGLPSCFLLLTMVVVLILTTVGLHFSTKSAKDTGVPDTFPAGDAKALSPFSSLGKKVKSAKGINSNENRKRITIKNLWGLLIMAIYMNLPDTKNCMVCPDGQRFFTALNKYKLGDRVPQSYLRRLC